MPWNSPFFFENNRIFTPFWLKRNKMRFHRNVECTPVSKTKNEWTQVLKHTNHHVLLIGRQYLLHKWLNMSFVSIDIWQNNTIAISKEKWRVSWHNCQKCFTSLRKAGPRQSEPQKSWTKTIWASEKLDRDNLSLRKAEPRQSETQKSWTETIWASEKLD